MQDQNFLKDFNKVTQFVDQSINPHVDFDKIASLVLGKAWKTATPDEQKRFKKEFQTLLVRTYSRAFSEFKEWSVRFYPLKWKRVRLKLLLKRKFCNQEFNPLPSITECIWQMVNGKPTIL